jgi:hypothetical protein
MSLAEPAASAQREARPLARFVKPALGLVLPVGLAIAWEIAVRMGVSDDGGCAAALAHLGDTGGIGRDRRIAAPQSPSPSVASRPVSPSASRPELYSAPSPAIRR